MNKKQRNKLLKLFKNKSFEEAVWELTNTILTEIDVRNKENAWLESIELVYNLIRPILGEINMSKDANHYIKESIQLIDNIEKKLPKAEHYKLNVIRNTLQSLQPNKEQEQYKLVKDFVKMFYEDEDYSKEFTMRRMIQIFELESE